MKRLLSFILVCAAVLLALLPQLAPAANGSDIVVGEDGTVTRAQWLHNLVCIFEMTAEEESFPDNYFTDLTTDHTYYEDIILAVEFGVVNVEAGENLYPDEPATRDFAAATLNFCLGYRLEEETAFTFTDASLCADPVAAQIAVNRGWLTLSEGAFCPEAILTSEEAERMLEDARTILAGQHVEADYDSTYTFTSDVTVIPEGTAVSEADGTVTVTDCPVSVTEGSKFAVYFNGIPQVYTAQSITVEN